MKVPPLVTTWEEYGISAPLLILVINSIYIYIYIFTFYKYLRPSKFFILMMENSQAGILHVRAFERQV